MGTLLTLIGAVCGIGSLVCFILVVIQMFKNDQTGMGIACIVLVFVCGIGGLVAFIVGWMNAGKWNITNIMWAWTGCILVGILVNGASFAMLGGQAAGGL
jgi:hypothetical protein